MQLEPAKGRRWKTKGGFLYLGFGSDIYAFHVEVGPLVIAVEPPREYWIGYRNRRRDARTKRTAQAGRRTSRDQ